MKRGPFQRRWGFLLIGVALLGGLAADTATEPAARPRYTPEKEFVLPSGYHTWVFVGANHSLRYDPELREPASRPGTRRDDETPGDFHNIYIDRTAYEQFLKTGTFPDPTVLVMEVFRAGTREPDGILSGGRFEGKRVALEAAVKDSRRPGGGVPWAYYVFQDGRAAEPRPSAAAKPDGACYDCHKAHASKDNVWVQFYPMLRDRELRNPKHDR
jgi:hypothetical protein